VKAEGHAANESVLKKYLTVGPGRRTRNHDPVPLIGDNEYGHLGRQGLGRRPGTQGDA
jgi:hypothetical protein